MPNINIIGYYTAKIYVDMLCDQPKTSTNTTQYATYSVHNDEKKDRAQNYRKVVLGNGMFEQVCGGTNF